ncbi:MAG: hypothetical protein HYV40_00960 [Candidatus Levybacteria bacterium]|nr:hypothetical protein [Candidatus Levybacteria bacterium]
MPTLHDVTEKTKLILKWGGIVLGIIVLLILLYRGGLFVKETFFPTPPPPPTVLFGQLDSISFPQKTSEKKRTYIIDTVTGKLPTFLDEKKMPRDRMKVYKISHNELTLLDLQSTRNLVASVGFSGRGIPIEGDIYRFQRLDPLPKTFDIDIVDKNFILTSQFPFNQEILDARNLPNQSEALTKTTSFMQSLHTYYQDLDPSKTKIQLLKLKNGVFFDAEKLEEAHVLRVDYFQKDIETFPIYYPMGIFSTMHFLVASVDSQSSLPIVLSNFYHQSIVTQENATYPIKSVAKAYQELTEGKGHIAANFVQGDRIPIKDVFLAYYATNERQDYLMPVYVFRGREDEFYAYVSAVDDIWIKDSSPTSKQSSR